MQAAAAQAHGKAGSPAAHGLPRNHPPAGPAGRAALADVVGLVLANAAVAWTQAERAALRLVCRDVCEARDAAARPGGLTIRVGGVPEGAEGAAQVARFFGRPGRRLPNSLTVQCVTSGQQERLLTVLQAAARSVVRVSLIGELPLVGNAACKALGLALPRVEHLDINYLGVDTCIYGGDLAAFLEPLACRLVSLRAGCAIGCWRIDAYAALAHCCRLTELRLGEARAGFTTACPTLEQLASLRHLRCLHLGCSGISWAPDGSDGSTSSSGREGSPRAELAALLCLSSQARLPNTPMPPQVISACHALGGWDALRELHLGRLPLDSQVLAALATSHITRLVAYRLQSPAGAYPPLGQPPEAELLAALSATKRGTALLPLPPLLRSLQLRRLPNLAALAALHPAPASLEHLTTSDSPHDSLPCTTITITLQPWQQIVSPDADQAAEDYWELADLHIYANSQLAGIVPHCMPSAAAFLAARRNEPTSLRVRAWEKKCKVSKMLEDVGTGFGLDGPHAAWMAALRPLGRTITSLELRNLAPTAPGDMTALAAALPALERLELNTCIVSDQALLELAAMARLRHLAFVDSVHVAQAECLAALIELCARLPALQSVAIKMDKKDYYCDRDGVREDLGSCDRMAALVRRALALRGRGGLVVQIKW